MESQFESFRKQVKHWYLPLLAGLVFIAIGIWTFLTPLESYLALSIVFSLSFLVIGMVEIVFSINNRKSMKNWGWILAFGIIGVLVGVMLLANPGVSLATLPFYLGFVVLFRSVGAVSQAFELKENKDLDWGNLMVMGVLGIIFSFFLLWNPILAGFTVVSWTALAFMAAGFYNIFLSLRLRKVKKQFA